MRSKPGYYGEWGHGHIRSFGGTYIITEHSGTRPVPNTAAPVYSMREGRNVVGRVYPQDPTPYTAYVPLVSAVGYESEGAVWRRFGGFISYRSF